MKALTVIFLLIFSSSGIAQVDYGTPGNEPLPEILNEKRRIIDVMHFPEQNDPILKDGRYYWKHATAILCKETTITITEFGAYLFYNNQWNLRRTYTLKELDEHFKTKKQQMEQATPYVWVDNQRIGKELFAGWALWYFIGTTPDGEVVCGYGKINTTNNLLN